MRVEIIKDRGPGNHSQTVILEPGQRLTLGRHPSCDVVFHDPTLSGKALELHLRPNGVVLVHAHQRFGHVLVRRTDGSTAADLQQGEAFVVPNGAGSVEVIGSRGLLAELRLTSARGPSTPPDATPFEELTDGQITIKQLIGSRTPQWLVVAALASVLARRARRTGDGNYPLPGEREKLLAASRAWYSHPWTSGWLTNRLDEAIHKFGLSVPTNADKVPRIAEHVLHSTLIRSKDLDLLDSELRRRSE